MKKTLPLQSKVKKSFTVKKERKLPAILVAAITMPITSAQARRYQQQAPQPSQLAMTVQLSKKTAGEVMRD
eukprot:13714665-Ditylum_brightwellii.AAC.1